MTLNDKVQVGESTTGTSTSTTYKVSSSPIEYGWVCPRCNRVNAPWKSTCDCSGGYYYPTWYPWDYREPWWKQVYCDSDTFKVHPETTTWKAPSSVCGSDNTASVKSNPDSIIYTTATNPIVGGSDYRDNMSQIWTNNPHVSNKVNPNTATTAWNNGPSTQTIHNGKTNYKE